jgi:hypothetical protein
MNHRSVVAKPVAICQKQTHTEMVTLSTPWSTDAWTGKHGDALHGVLGIANGTVDILEGFCSLPLPPPRRPTFGIVCR